MLYSANERFLSFYILVRFFTFSCPLAVKSLTGMSPFTTSKQHFLKPCSFSAMSQRWRLVLDLIIYDLRLQLPKEVGVFLPVWCFHRDPNYFPDPEKFDPERFNDENKHNIKPFTYLPFGVGPRNCIGE